MILYNKPVKDIKQIIRKLKNKKWQARLSPFTNK